MCIEVYLPRPHGQITLQLFLLFPRQATQSPGFVIPGFTFMQDLSFSIS